MTTRVLIVGGGFAGAAAAAALTKDKSVSVTLIEAEKVLVQKSGYFARSAAANSADRHLIERCATKAVECGLAGVPGCIGEDEEQGDELRAIEFERIAGGKAFAACWTEWWEGWWQERQWRWWIRRRRRWRGQPWWWCRRWWW